MRSLLFAALATSSLGALRAETPPPAIVLTVHADRPDALYKQGETVTFVIEATKGGQPLNNSEITWTLSKDGLPPYTNGTGHTVGGKTQATGTLAEPGFLQCRAAYRETPKSAPVTALGGAGIDPLQIQPSLPVPDDFDAFWAAQKRKLAAVPVNARLVPQISPNKAVELLDVQADSVGAPVSAYFGKPKDAEPKSLPAILLVHGAGVRSSQLGSTAAWAAKGMLAMDMNAHGIPNGKPETFYKELEQGALKDYRIAGRDDREKCYFLGMFLRLVRAIDFLTSQPEWNGRDVIVYGSSQGGYQSFAAAGIDERVTFFAAGVPAGCDHSGVVKGRVNGWPKFIPSLPVTEPDPKVLQTVRYFDCTNFAAHTHAKAAAVTVGFIDTTCPPTTVYAAYNALPVPKQIFNDIPHGHTNSPEATKFREAQVMKYLGR